MVEEHLTILRKFDLNYSELLVPKSCVKVCWGDCFVWSSDVFCCFSGQDKPLTSLSCANLMVTLIFRKFISFKVKDVVL